MSLPNLVLSAGETGVSHTTFDLLNPGLGLKVSDEWVVPLCVTHHRSLHDVGDEERWWKQHGSIDPISEAERLWEQTRATKFRKTSKELRVIRQATN